MQKQLNIPQFRFHDLRHYFASYASTLGIPEADIMAMGGWKSDHIFKSIYRESLEESRRESEIELGTELLKKH
jgi:integrase